jgi:hypothetical protein
MSSQKAISHIIELKELIAASLWHTPCTEDELCKRDFLRTTSDFGISKLLQQMEKDGWIYYKSSDETYHTYAKFARSQRMAKYELAPKTKHRRKTAQEAIKEYNKRCK